MRRVYPRGTRRLVTCHARCHGGARICQRTYERDALQGGAWCHGQIIRICRQKYDDSRPTAGAMGGSLQQPPAAMLEISRRHSVMLHGSCIPSFEIERATMNCHDQRGPSRASLHGLRSEVEFRRKPRVKYPSVLPPSCVVPGGRKKNGLRARFSAHPQPAPQCVGEAHWSVGRRRLGRPARPQTEEGGVLLGGAVAGGSSSWTSVFTPEHLLLLHFFLFIRDQTGCGENP